ncbi:hypothetical protein CIB48_g2161 [Xylaria polymorpha]|nr:hypothetical protein CIB48_g2161 [Xylaria polymorpha]
MYRHNYPKDEINNGAEEDSEPIEADIYDYEVMARPDSKTARQIHSIEKLLMAPLHSLYRGRTKVAAIALCLARSNCAASPQRRDAGIVLAKGLIRTGVVESNGADVGAFPQKNSATAALLVPRNTGTLQ